MSESENYFNYFTEIEEHFQKVRGTSLFLLSPLDWALIESWKNSGIPLTAVLHGIDAAFEKWRDRRIKTQNVNSLAFCSQAVLSAAERTPEGEPEPATRNAFELDEIQEWIRARIADLETKAEYREIEHSLRGIAEEDFRDLEKLESRLTAMEQRMIAIARSTESEAAMLDDARDLEQQLQPYKRKMSAAQIDMLQRQFAERRLLERHSLPRLSLFYLKS